MKNKTLHIALSTSLGMFLLIACAWGQENRSNQRTIQGTWRTTVTPRNCQTGAAVAPAFPGLLTFNKGGTMTGTSATVTSAYGIWDREHGRQNYSFAFVSLRYNNIGAVIGSQTVRQTAVLDASGDAFTSTGTAEILDLAGTVVGTGCATSTGKRFE